MGTRWQEQGKRNGKSGRRTKTQRRYERIKNGALLIAVVGIVSLTAIWGGFVYQINRKFPEREEVIYRTGEWVKLKSGLEVCPEEYYFVEDEDIRKMEGIQEEQLFEGEMKLIYVRYKVRNNSETELADNLAAALPLQTSGWWNYPNLNYQIDGGDSPMVQTKLAPGEETEITYPYLFLKENFRGNGWEKIESGSYSVVLSLYPQKQMIKLD